MFNCLHNNIVITFFYRFCMPNEICICISTYKYQTYVYVYTYMCMFIHVWQRTSLLELCVAYIAPSYMIECCELWEQNYELQNRWQKRQVFTDSKQWQNVMLTVNKYSFKAYRVIPLQIRDLNMEPFECSLFSTVIIRLLFINNNNVTITENA